VTTTQVSISGASQWSHCQTHGRGVARPPERCSPASRDRCWDRFTDTQPLSAITTGRHRPSARGRRSCWSPAAARGARREAHADGSGAVVGFTLRMAGAAARGRRRRGSAACGSALQRLEARATPTARRSVGRRPGTRQVQGGGRQRREARTQRQRDRYRSELTMMSVDEGRWSEEESDQVMDAAVQVSDY
jgi:hypothetical protein